MKILFAFIGLLFVEDGFSQTIFFDDFNDNTNNWTVGNNKHVSSKIEGGIYYLTAQSHAYGDMHEVKIDTKKDFEIETRIKIVSGGTEHKNFYSMLFWGREGMDAYYFTFAKDGYVSVQTCDGKNQRDCVTQEGSFKKTELDPAGFNVYLIKKVGRNYSFFVNGAKVYEMPFTPFFGNMIGVGAGRKVSLAIDYLKVRYL